MPLWRGALYFFVRAFFMYREIADLAVSAIEFKVGMTQAVLKGAGGMGLGLVGDALQLLGQSP